MRTGVLFVARSEAALDDFRQIFRRAPFEVFTSTSARLALDVLSEARIDVVVCDERPHEMSGQEFLRVVGRLFGDVTRIGLGDESAGTDPSVGHLTKPCAPKRLGRAIAQGLRARRTPAHNSTNRARLLGTLEAGHPGITRVVRAADGSVVLE